MSDLSSMSRESKKRQLRRQMLDPSDSGKPGKKLKRPRESRSEEEEIVLEAGRKVRRRKRRIILTLLAVLVIAGGGFYLYKMCIRDRVKIVHLADFLLTQEY